MIDEKSSVAMDPWFLVQLKPNGFSRAVTNLRRQNVSTFMPLCPAQTTKGSNAAAKPLFPGYLFAGFDPFKISFTTVNSTFGVLRIVTTGCRAEQGLPKELIEGLRSRCDENDFLVPVDDLKVNESVRITAGPFARFIAVVDQLQSSNRVQVLFGIMGQVVRAEISTQDLERIIES